MAVAVNALEPFSVCARHVRNGWHGEGAWRCLERLCSQILGGEGVRWEDLTPDTHREV